jgi:hypothetical protein
VDHLVSKDLKDQEGNEGYCEDLNTTLNISEVSCILYVWNNESI